MAQKQLAERPIVHVRFEHAIHFGAAHVSETAAVGSQHVEALEPNARGIFVVVAGKAFMVPWSQVSVVTLGE